MNPSTRELTFGEKAVGLDFNVSGDPKITEVKQLYANVIDIANDARKEVGPGEKARYYSTSITYAEIACMEAVKGITYKY